MREIHKGHRALNLKPLEHKLMVVYIQTLDDIYEAIDARCFDIMTRAIGKNKNKVFDIYGDDEGLFNPNNHLAAYGYSSDCVIVGDILIAKHDAQGDMVDLTHSDIDYIGKHICRTFDRMNREIDILFPISYPNCTR